MYAVIAEDISMESASEALGNGVCYIFGKPPSHRDISTVWQHIPRVTGEMPGGSRSIEGAARDRKLRNSKGKLIDTDIDNKKRTMKNTVDNSKFSNDSEETDGHNPKKPRITWTSYLHQKFLRAINILGEQSP